MKLSAEIPNPFHMGVMPDPWKAVDVDVPDIHRNVFQVCCEAVDYVRTAQQSAGVLIHGQAGSGKTHLLSRLRSHLANDASFADLDEPSQVFVSVRLATSPRRIWRHTRERFIDDLLRPLPDGLTQLDHVLAMRMAELADGGGDLARWWEYMRDENPDELDNLLDELARSARVSDELLYVLEQLMCGRNRRAARAWLRGEALSETNLHKLGLPVRAEDTEEEEGTPEQHAKDVVLQLCRLAGSRVPVVFCFDQIEALELNPGDVSFLHSFGKLITDLHDETHNSVLISCIQSRFHESGCDQAKNGEAQAMAEYAEARLRSHAVRMLSPLLLEDAKALVKARLDASPELNALGRHKESEFWPLSLGAIIEGVPEQGCSPRELLAYCARKFAELQTADNLPPAPPMPLPEFLRQTWERRLQDRLWENDPEETESLLIDVIPLLVPLATHEWTVDPGNGGSGLRDVDMVLRNSSGDARIAVTFATQASMNSLVVRLRRLKDARPLPFEKHVLIRDSRTPISRGAVRVQEYLKELETDGALISRPGVETMAALEALRSLLSDATSGDLEHDGDLVSIDSVRDWLAHHLAEPLQEFVGELVAYPGAGGCSDPIAEPDSNDMRRDQLMELLDQRHVLPLDEVAREMQCAPGDLETLIAANRGEFRLMPGPPAVVFQPVTQASVE